MKGSLRPDYLCTFPKPLRKRFSHTFFLSFLQKIYFHALYVDYYLKQKPGNSAPRFYPEKHYENTLRDYAQRKMILSEDVPFQMPF